VAFDFATHSEEEHVIMPVEGSTQRDPGQPKIRSRRLQTTNKLEAWVIIGSVFGRYAAA
jgi:hypothetical protein